MPSEIHFPLKSSTTKLTGKWLKSGMLARVRDQIGWLREGLPTNQTFVWFLAYGSRMMIWKTREVTGSQWKEKVKTIQYLLIEFKKLIVLKFEYVKLCWFYWMRLNISWRWKILKFKTYYFNHLLIFRWNQNEQSKISNLLSLFSVYHFLSLGSTINPQNKLLVALCNI